MRITNRKINIMKRTVARKNKVMLRMANKNKK